jgi:hypothetical protein
MCRGVPFQPNPIHFDISCHYNDTSWESYEDGKVKRGFSLFIALHTSG